MTRRPLPVDRLHGLLPSERGLSADEVQVRRQRYGSNDIVEVAGNPWAELARETARDPMIWFLVGMSVLYGILGDVMEALTLFAAVVPLVGIDAFLHRRTRASTEGLSSRLATRATVMRDGRAVEIAAVEIVPGDLVVVSVAEPFPADGVIVAGSELQVDESVLTGEAYPIRKGPLAEVPHDGGEPAVETEHWAFAGTRLLTGRATVRVAYTGQETVYGEIVRSASSGTRTPTPLQAAIASLVSVLVAAAAVMCLVLAFVRVRQGYGWVDALVSALTLAVAALPEEFPVVFTFFLGVGVYRLAKRQALVRRAVSVENIGRVTCICSDKTGTLTEGRLHLTHLVPADDLADERLLTLAAIAARQESNDPLDAAILREADTRGARAGGFEVLEIFPFTEDSRRETAIVRSDGRVLAATKGSPEVIIAMATLGDADRQAWEDRVAGLAAEGHRVIGCAWRLLDGETWAGDEPRRGYRFAGLLALEDPVRPGVADAVHACRDAGIHTIMVTGDHPLTAQAVAREVGLGGGTPTVISGEELEDCIANGTGQALPRVDVIARAVPSQKLALVRALQARHEIVAVTGDGVNDVPALQAADIGIAMGERGTRSAREVAAIVLLDDNFRTIVRAIGEGRQLFRNLQLSFQYLMLIHIPLVITAAVIPLAGYPVLYLPVHIVWLEMLIHPTALLVFQDMPAAGRLGRIRRHRNARFFSNRDWLMIAVVGTLITAMVVGGYVRSVDAGRNVEHGRAMALAVLTLVSAVVTVVLSRLRTWASRVLTAATILMSVALIQIPTIATRLHVQPLHLDDWGQVLLGSFITGAVLAVSGTLSRE
ncbi:MAG: ATPase, P-type (transporting), superfamily, subfamily [Deltaproteobacteria bacterium]|nr:ATPase, P-type (transporting), superfamily, subfamily [Deltaproteobacteria bacterium]